MTCSHFVGTSRLDELVQPLQEEFGVTDTCCQWLGKRRFSVAAPSVWNSLPLNLRTDHNSLRGFKTNLKTQQTATLRKGRNS